MHLYGCCTLTPSCVQTLHAAFQRLQRSDVSSRLLHIEQLSMQNEEKQTNTANE